MASDYFVGIDLGGTNIKAGLVDARGKVLSSFSVPTEVTKGRKRVLDNMVGAVQRAVEEAGVKHSKVAGVGIGTPGPMSHSKGIVINPGNLPCMKNTPLRKTIQQRTRLKTTIENDANAAAWGEFWAGAGRGVKDLVMFTLGTGVGGGVITDGKMLRGYFENGAELGHIIVQPRGRLCSCGQHGCVEAYSSAENLARHAEELIKAGGSSRLMAMIEVGREIRAEHVEAAAKAGDQLAGDVWEQACYYLAVAIVTMQHVVNPQRVVLAGGLIAAGSFLLSPVRQHFRSLTWKLMKDFPEIRFATLGDNAGFIGAAGCAWAAAEGLWGW